MIIGYTATLSLLFFAALPASVSAAPAFTLSEASAGNNLVEERLALKKQPVAATPTVAQVRPIANDLVMNIDARDARKEQVQRAARTLAAEAKMAWRRKLTKAPELRTAQTVQVKQRDDDPAQSVSDDTSKPDLPPPPPAPPSFPPIEASASVPAAPTPKLKYPPPMIAAARVIERRQPTVPREIKNSFQGKTKVSAGNRLKAREDKAIPAIGYLSAPGNGADTLGDNVGAVVSEPSSSSSVSLPTTGFFSLLTGLAPATTTVSNHTRNVTVSSTKALEVTSIPTGFGSGPTSVVPLNTTLSTSKHHTKTSSHNATSTRWTHNSTAFASVGPSSTSKVQSISNAANGLFAYAGTSLVLLALNFL